MSNYAKISVVDSYYIKNIKRKIIENIEKI